MTVRRRQCALLLTAALALVSGACRSAPKKADPAAPSLPRPTTRGLQMYWWGFDDGGDPAALARILREYVANSVPLSPAQVQSWKSNGLRMLSVPRGDLPQLEQALRVTGAQRKTMGELTTWGPLVLGPTWTSRQRLQMPTGELTLDAGRLRLIARSWTASDVIPARDGAPGQLRFVTRVEMAAQHEEQDRLLERDPLSVSDKPRTIQSAGLILSGTAVGFDIWPGEAIVIFPEPPESDLVALSTSRPEPVESATDPLGPEPLRQPTVGELLLAGGPLGKHPARRAVIVLLGESASAP